MANTEVMIIGAGPSGLMMALTLQKEGIPFRIIEKKSSFSDQSKALAIQARSLEILERLEVIDPFLKKGKKLENAFFFHNKNTLGHVDFRKMQSPYPFPLCLEQSETENILREKLASLRVSIETETELVSIKPQKEKVDLVLQKKNEIEQATASWVVGCDGCHSLVRKSLSLSFKGKLFKDVFSLADLYIKGDIAESSLSIFLEPSGVMAIFPLPEKNKFRLIFQMEKYRNFLRKNASLEHGVLSSKDIPSPTMEEAQNMLSSYVNGKIELYNPVWLANFHINSRLTTKYQVDSLFLVGDAAHIHSPVGGQGMNTGFQDAFNLAWKLSYVIKKKSPPSLLKTYQKERGSVGKTLLAATERASFMATLHASWAVFLRNSLLSFLLKKDTVTKKIASAISQTAIQYPKSTFCYEKGSFSTCFSLGQRAPDFPFYRGEKEETFFSLQRKCSSILLFFLQDKEKTEEPWLENACKELPLSFLWISSKKQQGVLFDPEKKAHNLYSPEKEAIYFIKPDGHVGFRVSSIDLLSVKEYLQKVFLFS